MLKRIKINVCFPVSYYSFMYYETRPTYNTHWVVVWNRSLVYRWRITEKKIYLDEWRNHFKGYFEELSCGNLQLKMHFYFESRSNIIILWTYLVGVHWFVHFERAILRGKWPYGKDNSWSKMATCHYENISKVTDEYSAKHLVVML